MSPRLARLLTHMYPPSWRKRYGAEFEELLETGHGGLRTVVNVVWSGLCERISPKGQSARDQSAGPAKSQSLCSRAPWVIFSLGPVALLIGCYVVACLILWVGWTIFKPGSDTPFGGGQIHGLENLYFQFGKYFYGSAPMLVGWVIAALAARHRAKAMWPLISFVLVAWIGAAARIHASRTEIPDQLGHIRMDFALWPWLLSGQESLVHALIILLLVVLPYLVWRIRVGRTMSA